MIILPDSNTPRAKLLLAMDAKYWRTPSQAQDKNVFGHENQTRFSATLRAHDGHIIWRGWFDDREDFDTFAWAIATDTLKHDKHIQRLCTPCWHSDLQEHTGLKYELITTAFITSGTSFSVPLDCAGVSGSPGEFIDTIGAGASGGGAISFNFLLNAGGGGGGAWSRITSLSLTPGGSVTVQVGVGGASKTANGFGNAGTDTWFNGANLAASSVGAKAGAPGDGGTISTRAGGAGGASASGIGTSKNSGGRGGNSLGTTSATIAAGGGGAAGPNGAGLQGVDTPATGLVATNGGNGDNGSGGAGSAGATAGASSNGGAGTEYDATHGSGGGSGGCARTSVSASGAGGTYGGGSGGNALGVFSGAPASGKGGDGLIVFAYQPVAKVVGINMPMLGM